jgi:hypothetical protein
MERQITISYNWTCNKGIKIPEKHREVLAEDAEKRIFEMIGEGYTSGELHTYVRYGKDEVPEENEDGLSYSGWFSISNKTLG